MAQIKPTYEELQEVVDIAKKLVDKYPEQFGGIDTSLIKCLAINNKERSEKKRMWEIKAVQAPISEDFNEFLYYITVYMNDWVELSEAQKSLLVADALHALPVDGEEKLNTFDVKGYRRMLATFGLDFMDDPMCPDLLKDDAKVDWKY